MINAAIIGLGRWGQRLVDSVQSGGTPKGNSIRFTRAVVRSPGGSNSYAQSQGLHLGDSLDDVLADPSIHAVVLATPHDVHAAQILQAAQAGKHVFAEKPLALTHADAESAVYALQKSKLVLGVGHNRRFLPAAEVIKSMIASGQLGTVVHAEGNFSNNSGLSYEPTMWRAGEEGAKASMTAMGVHILDFFVHLCGPIETVAATGTRIAMPVAVSDVVSVNLRFASGATGYLSTILTTPRQWRVQIFGTAGWAHLRDEHILDVCDARGNITSTTFDTVDTVRAELESFAGAVEGKAPFPISAFDLVHVPAALQAVLQSSAGMGEEVSVPRASPYLEHAA
jgi:predicted dehydrogenase